MVRAIRGAITADGNTKEAIEEATTELMREIVERNNITEEDVISVIFTSTSDLDQQYPSVSLRSVLGWNETPILNFEEKKIANSLKMCIRVLLHIHSEKNKDEIVHVYLKGAQKLRPDLCLK